MKWLALSAIVGTTVVVAQVSRDQKMMQEGVASTYEHLATAMLELRATEDNLVRGILMHHEGGAVMALSTAAKSSGAEQKRLLESAAEEISILAAEGDKGVQAVRQRLLKAGHHHHTDADTKEDYIWIDSKEKKAFLALASRVPKLADSASMNAAAKELEVLFEKAVVPD